MCDVKRNKKRPRLVQFCDSQISYNLTINLTYIIAVYIVIPDIFIKLIRASFYTGRRPFPFKLIDAKIIKYLLNDLIIFNIYIECL